ncbi:MAG TPA: cytochrome c-type biogenesis protein CcmH [Vicinamibacterales bacterium]|nr:cytochrome c-type biogenesis protein CcmH [Vicinamibacterales bacterium]
MRLTIVAALLVFLAAPAVAVDREAEARAIEAMLVAPCCWSQQVSVHQSEAATRIKTEIREALAAGRARQAILDGYVQQYGTKILVEPPARGFAAWLYVTPVVALVFSAAGVGLLVRKFARRGASAERPQEPPSADVELAARLDEELQDLD